MTTATNSVRKTVCPITREQFYDKADSLPVQINGDKLEADVKQFTTGSLGWYYAGKAKVEIGGVRVPVQIGLNITVIGSKQLPE